LFFGIPIHGFSEPQFTGVKVSESATTFRFRTYIPAVREIEEKNGGVGAGIGYSLKP
jgi:hypothetical protein